MREIGREERDSAKASEREEGAFEREGLGGIHRGRERFRQPQRERASEKDSGDREGGGWTRGQAPAAQPEEHDGRPAARQGPRTL